MKLKYHLYLLFFISISIPQLSYELSTAQSVIDDAVYELYNFRFDQSLSLLDKAEVLDSKHPLIPFLTTTLLWQKSQTEEGSDQWEIVDLRWCPEGYIRFFRHWIMILRNN